MVLPRPRFRGRARHAERGTSPVVGVALMVAITVLLAAVVVVMLSSTADPDVAPTIDTAVSLDPTDAGTDLTTEYSGGQEIDVRIDGETIATLDGDSTGSTVFLPTAPGDEVHLVAANDDSEILVRETFDAGEAGDFVAYYPFDDDGDTLRDRSLHGNHGEFENDAGGGDPVWGTDEHGTYREFDGADQSVDVSDLRTGDVDVRAFTVAIAFSADDLDDTDQLVEHNDDDNREWHVETTGDSALQFGVDFHGGHYFETDPDVVREDERHVAVGTYDGETYALYRDGEELENATHEMEVDMGRMRIGEDDSNGDQHFAGRIYEFRLYYTAFDDHQVEMLTEVMD